jgi:HSP20 family protein
MVAKKEKISVKKKAEAGKGEIVPWRPSEFLGEIDGMFDEFRRRFDSMLIPIRSTWPKIAFPWFELPDVREPFADLIDAGKEYRVSAEMPGVPKEQIDVTVTPRGIEISAETKTKIDEEKEGYVRKERGYSRFHRNLTFPEEVMPDKAEAALNNGMLEVRVPKKTPTETKKHKVSVK